jgi:hypothetical protein
LRNRSKFNRIDVKLDNVLFNENFEEDFLSKRDKNDNFDQKKDDLSTL